jgi:hypothetical protein
MAWNLRPSAFTLSRRHEACSGPQVLIYGTDGQPFAGTCWLPHRAALAADAMAL